LALSQPEPRAVVAAAIGLPERLIAAKYLRLTHRIRVLEREQKRLGFRLTRLEAGG
jgi:hypothetical protein